MTFPTYPYVTLQDSIAGFNFSADQVYELLNEDENFNVVAQNGLIPSFRNLQKQIINTYGTLNVTGAWVTATSYSVNDLVQESGTWYICLISHTSGVFATDLAAGRWQVFQTTTNNIARFLEPRQFTTAGQTLVTLSTYTYTTGINNLTVVVGGVPQRFGEDFTETSTSSFTFTEPQEAGLPIDIYINDNTTSFTVDAANVSYTFGSNVETALAHPVLPNHTDAELDDISDAVNTTNKAKGSMVYNTDLEKPVWATGNTAGATWKDAVGTVTNTPV